MTILSLTRYRITKFVSTRRRRARHAPRLELLEGRELLSLSTIATLTLPPADPLAGRPFTLVATVSSPSGGTPTGTVTFYDGPMALWTAALARLTFS